ncbi:hypothetical protein TRFO_09361 [Tritrichomonas foetus]|uniref:Uncharacterized protein n=1 Tax=Tritrichomonas foetus TaxID=1144522 RepID=A0A1J4JER8_9EUKA|nr:hypothetical protein TRFO_09361 [Tritrichomonas foetus]|eukprot:OHS97650.1 hypothetical protein TRFO_09361 [Tritrichomonas foetus]
MSAHWMSRGADTNSAAFYSTTYSSSYTRPNTTQNRSTFPELRPNDTSGFSSNNHVSPLELNPLNEKSIYQTSSHVAHSDASTVKTLMQPKPIARAVMEHSGFWHETEPNVLYESPAMRVSAAREREINANYLDPHTLKRMSHKNPIEGENHGAGPKWGSTTNNTAFCNHQTSHDRYWTMDRSLIGKKEHNGFTRQHVTLKEEPIDDMISTTKEAFTRPPRTRAAEVPNRTVMERSGFSNAAVPIINHKMMLSDVSADQLHPIEVNRLRHKNTPEHQNLYHPDPYLSTAQVSYQTPNRTITRALTAAAPIRHGSTGYLSNENVIAGPPGDPRYHKTGKTETTKRFVDPSTLRTRDITQTPNVVERSGYWAT